MKLNNPEESALSLPLVNRQALWVYVVTAIGFVVSISFTPYPGSMILKAVPIVTLMFIVWVTLSGKLRAAMLVALLFSAVGDVCLEAGVFLAGLSAFLVAQLTYAWVFIPRRNINTLSLIQATVLVSTLILISGYVLAHTGDMKLPVAIYMTAITLMGLGAALHARPSAMIFAGAVLFITSDSLIGINRFVHPVENAREWIMVTYYLAQILLVYGVIFHQEAQKTKRG
ncbi:putative membrane protein [Halioglobus japonicus]|nr:putative membrane protein [Halioglobus japonicus]